MTQSLKFHISTVLITAFNADLVLFNVTDRCSAWVQEKRLFEVCVSWSSPPLLYVSAQNKHEEHPKEY